MFLGSFCSVAGYIVLLGGPVSIGCAWSAKNSQKGELSFTLVMFKHMFKCWTSCYIIHSTQNSSIAELDNLIKVLFIPLSFNIRGTYSYINVLKKHGCFHLLFNMAVYCRSQNKLISLYSPAVNQHFSNCKICRAYIRNKHALGNEP